MPARHAVELEERLVYTTFSGVVTLDEVVRWIASLRADLHFDSAFDEIVDLSGASDIRLGYDEFKRLEGLDPFSDSSKRALVIPNQSCGLWRHLDVSPDTKRRPYDQDLPHGAGGGDGMKKQA